MHAEWELQAAAAHLPRKPAQEEQMSVETGREAPVVGAAEQRPVEDDHGYGWVVFSGVLLLVAGTLNTIYGIAAIDDSQFFVNDS